MSGREWLLVDTSNLAYRAFFTTGGLSYDGEPTGVSFGVLRELDALIDLHQPETVIFAFDSRGPGRRAEIDPNYKANRTNLTDEERQQRATIHEEVDRLKSSILPSMGFKNIWGARGYEADDIIAQTAQRLPDDVRATIVSGDEDLWQCLSGRVRQYHPRQKQMVTAKTFRLQWGIDPIMWANVKALAGCKTDNVDGVDGVGEKTAAKWFAGTLKKESKAYTKISENLDIHNRNIPLVKLPLTGLELPPVRADECTEAKRMNVLMELGIRPRRGKRKGFEL